MEFKKKLKVPFITNNKACLLLTIVLYTLLNNSFAQSEWELSVDKNGVKVYTRDYPNSNFKESKTITITKGRVEEYVNILQDIKTYKDWMPMCEETKLIQNAGDSIVVYYLKTDVPWPVSDRDGVYYNKYKFDSAKNKVNVSFHIQQNIEPKYEGVVRLTKANGGWLIRQISENEVKIIYQLHADIGGSVPAWLAKSGATDTPYEMIFKLTELRNQLVKSGVDLNRKPNFMQ